MSKYENVHCDKKCTRSVECFKEDQIIWPQKLNLLKWKYRIKRNRIRELRISAIVD